MTHRLPSMAGLRAFEAAARHLSFTKAGIELGLTQGAVSHQLRNLEELLNTRLFVRQGNEVGLTEAGKDYLHTARSVITELQVATDRAIDRQSGEILTVACLGTFAIKCLFPALNDFTRRHPGVRLRVRTLVPHAPMPPEDYDISIQYGLPSDWPRLAVERISDEEIFPVCSPRLQTGPKPLRRPQDLSDQILIRTSSPLILRDDWPLWMEAAGISGQRFAGEISCDLLYPSYQAAIDGLGVAMGRSAVVSSDVAAGRLIEPFRVRLPSPLGYHLVMAQARADLTKVRLFAEWAIEQFDSLRFSPSQHGVA